MDGKHPTMRNMTNSESIDRRLLPSSSILFASHPEHSTLSTSPVPVVEGTRNTSIFQAPDASSTSLQRLPSETFPRVNSDDGDDNYYVADGDVGECDLDEEGLLARIQMNRMRLERLRNKQQNQSGQLKTQEAATLRMNSSIAQDEILKSVLKTMQTCNARGFVYGIISEKGEPISGTSDNLRDWWKEQVRFDCNGPAAAEKYAIEHSASAGSDDQKTD